MDFIIFLIPVIGIAGLLFTVWKSAWVKRQDGGNEKMQRISDHIYNGAMAFLKAEYRILAIFVLGVSVLLLRAGVKKHPMVR